MAKQKRQGEQGSVVDIDARRKEEVERTARLFAEASAKGNPSAEARAFVDEKFETDPSWHEYGDLMGDAMDTALDKFWLGYLTKKGVTVAAERLKAELGHADASPAERVLIEHAVLCHVRLGMIEHLYSRRTTDRMDVTEHYEKRLTLAQRRFTRAVETLARVRALLARAEVARDAAERSRASRGLALARKAG